MTAPVARPAPAARGLAALWRWQAAHPRLVDAALAVVVFAAVVWGPLAGPDHDHDHMAGPVLDLVTLVVLAVGAGALTLRRTHPVAVWAVSVLAGIAIVVHTGEAPTAAVLTYITLYTVGTRTPLRTTLAAAVTTAVAYALAVTLHDGVFGDRTLALVAFAGAAAAVGIAVRSQRAAVEAAEARAHQAEATRDEEAERRVTDERLRIARELHDVVAHHISVINVQAGVARHLMEVQPEQARTALGLVREASRTVLADMTTVLGLLRTGEDERPTEPAPGLHRLPAVVDTMGRAGLRTTWRTEGEPYPVPEIADLSAFRIVQESLTNALKHGTGTADLLLEYAPAELRITVRNPVRTDGASTSGGGHGLVGMRERVASVGGRFTAEREADGAFVVRATVPRSGA